MSKAGRQSNHYFRGHFSVRVEDWLISFKSWTEQLADADRVKDVIHGSPSNLIFLYIILLWRPICPRSECKPSFCQIYHLNQIKPAASRQVEPSHLQWSVEAHSGAKVQCSCLSWHRANSAAPEGQSFSGMQLKFRSLRGIACKPFLVKIWRCIFNDLHLEYGAVRFSNLTMKRTLFPSASNFWPLVSPVASLELDPSLMFAIAVPILTSSIMPQNPHDPKQLPSPSPTQPTRFLPKSPTGSGVATGSVGKRDAKMEGRPGEVKGADIEVTGLHRIIFSLPEAKDNQPQEELVGLASNAQPRPSRKRRKVTCPICNVAWPLWAISFLGSMAMPKPRDQLCTCMPPTLHTCVIPKYGTSCLTGCLTYHPNWNRTWASFSIRNNRNIHKEHLNPTILTQMNTSSRIKRQGFVAVSIKIAMIHKIDKLITNENNLPKFATCFHFPSHLILTLYFLNHLEAISWSLSFKAQLFWYFLPLCQLIYSYWQWNISSFLDDFPIWSFSTRFVCIEKTRLLGFNQALLHASNHKVWWALALEVSNWQL